MRFVDQYFPQRIAAITIGYSSLNAMESFSSPSLGKSEGHLSQNQLLRKKPPNPIVDDASVNNSISDATVIVVS